MQLFKNALIYQIEESFELSEGELESSLSESPLIPCGKEEVERFGWLPAYSEGEQFVEQINQALFFRLGIEEKKIPRRVIQTAVEQRAREHNLDLSSRSRYKEVEEIVLQELIRGAYPERSSIVAYIDMAKRWLIIDATSLKRASILTSALRKSLGSLPITTYAPKVSLPLMMTHWVKEGLPDRAFQFLSEVELKELEKEEGGVARYRGIPLDSNEILHNIAEGWQVTRLAFAYQERISFSLGEDFILKRLRFLEEFYEEVEESDDAYQALYSTVYLQVSLLRHLLSDLYHICHQ